MKIDDTTVEIPLTQGKVALVDAADFNLVASYKWHAHKNRKTFYATTGITISKGRFRLLRMHRLIAGANPDQEVDHKDGDGLNNQRSNLRIATTSQNIANSSLRKDNTSGYRGVSWRESLNKWQVYITVKGQRLHLGFFLDKQEAARAYDAAARTYFGDFAYLNFMEAVE